MVVTATVNVDGGGGDGRSGMMEVGEEGCLIWNWYDSSGDASSSGGDGGGSGTFGISILVMVVVLNCDAGGRREEVVRVIV